VLPFWVVEAFNVVEHVGPWIGFKVERCCLRARTYAKVLAGPVPALIEKQLSSFPGFFADDEPLLNKALDEGDPLLVF